jgi:hypothetical protein
MYRFVTFILLATVALGPSAGWFCERACGAEYPSAVAVEDCHRSAQSAPAEASRNGGGGLFREAMDDAESAQPAPAVVGGHDCSRHARHAALITKRAQASSESFLAARAPSSSGPSALTAVARVSPSSLLGSGPRLSGFFVPLRI